MDKALDEVIGERQRRNQAPRPRRRNDDWGRDNHRKSGRDDFNRIDDDWLHDKYEDDDDPRAAPRFSRNRRPRERESPDHDLTSPIAKLRVENLHYELTEDDLTDLFTRIAPVHSLTLTYDRAGRSTGTAYVTYRTVTSARAAIREYDGANANGQPIRLSLVPSGPASGSARGDRGRDRDGGSRRNPFDSAIPPGRSLFDRIETPPAGGGSRSRRRGGGSRDRSRSPPARRSDTRKPPPDGIDRYVPGEDRAPRRARSRSPLRRRDHSGARRGGSARRAPRRDRDDEGRPMVQGRPRMTQEELDRDMDSYWGSKQDANGDVGAGGASADTGATPAPAAGGFDGDVDMIE